jgi:hypothetical protein
MKAIDKARIDRPYYTDEEIISKACPTDNYNVKSHPLCNCNWQEDICTKCWEQEIMEEK